MCVGIFSYKKSGIHKKMVRKFDFHDLEGRIINDFLLI